MSRPRWPARTFRPGPVYDDAREQIEARGRGVQDLLVAALRWFVHDPEAALKTLAGHWPEPKPRGRPRRDETPTE